jgi:hypothetical protein
MSFSSKPFDHRQERIIFCMTVNDVFNIHDRDLVVSGTVEQGVIRVGDSIFFKRSGALRKVKVSKIEQFRKTLNEAKQGDYVGMELCGVRKGDVVPGDLLVGSEEQLGQMAPPSSLRTQKATNAGVAVPTPEPVPTVTREQVLERVKAAMDEKDDSRTKDICIEIVKGGASYERHIKDIILDKSVDFYTRRFALKIGAGFKDAGDRPCADFREFILLHLIAGQNKAALIYAYENGEDPEGARVGLFVTGEEILNTPDFFERYVIR